MVSVSVFFSSGIAEKTSIFEEGVEEVVRVREALVLTMVKPFVLVGETIIPPDKVFITKNAMRVIADNRTLIDQTDVVVFFVQDQIVFISESIS